MLKKLITPFAIYAYRPPIRPLAHRRSSCSHRNVEYPTAKKTNFTPVTNNTKDLLNSSTKTDSLCQGVFWLAVKYTVFSIHHLAASSCSLHFFEVWITFSNEDLNSIKVHFMNFHHLQFAYSKNFNLFDLQIELQSYYTLDTINFFREWQENRHNQTEQAQNIIISNDHWRSNLN